MDKLAPLITVIIPVYNRESIVTRTLDSIASQSLKSFKTILVDNNSTDNTASVLAHWAEKNSSSERPVSVLTETIPGAAAARQAGLEAADTEWILFFDSDDTMAPRHLERIAGYIHTHPDTDIAGWNVTYAHLDGKSRTHRFYDSDMSWHNIVHGSFATLRYCARRSLFLRAGGWNPNVRFWDDIELGARLLALKPTVRHIGPEVTVFVHETETSITGTSYADSLRRAEAPLELISKVTPKKLQPLFPIKLLIEAALADRQGVPDGKIFLKKLLDETSSPISRTAYRFAFSYTRRGGRGIATLLRPFFPLLKV